MQQQSIQSLMKQLICLKRVREMEDEKEVGGVYVVVIDDVVVVEDEGEEE